jgi:hypothetical protein
MRDTAEIATLRTMLKDVNVEYSALLRGKGHENKPASLEGLRGQRLALMSRIAELRQRESAHMFPTRGTISTSGVTQAEGLEGLVFAAKSVTAAVQRYWAGWMRGSQSPSGVTALPSD